MELTWTNIIFTMLPILAGVAGAFIKDYINNAVQDVKINMLESKISHINNNTKQRDIAIFEELKDLKEEIKQLSIQIAEIGAKRYASKKIGGI